MSDRPTDLPRKVNAGGNRRRPAWRAGKAPSASGSREVVVRVTGRMAAARLAPGLDYITRGGDLPGEHSSGAVVHGREALRHLARRWEGDNAAYETSPGSPTQAVGVVLSMPAGTPLDAVTASAREWARAHLSGRTEWLMVAHDDRAHPHVHVSVRAVGLDGHRLRASPGEVQEWREGFAAGLRARGVEADATPRHEKLERLRERRQARERDVEAPPLVPEF